MPTFTYKALRTNGQQVTGELVANSRSEAYRMLDRDRMQPLSLVQKGDPKAPGAAKQETKALPKGGIRLSRGQIILFTEEMSDLLEAGLQLEPALGVMEGRQELGGLKQLAAHLRQQIREGASFSVALRNTSKSFDELYCNMAAAGEVSGALPQILKRQSEFLIKMGELQGKVVSSLVYPAFVSLLGGALVFTFMTYLVPQLTKLFEGSGKSLPFTTQLLIDISSFLGNYWWAVIGGTALSFAAFRQFITTPAGKMWWDEKRLALPLVGPILSSTFYTRFAATLSTMVSNGIPLLTGLRLMRDAIERSNSFMHRHLVKIVDIVGEGGSLSRAMRKVGYFPPLMVDMIVVGEQTGDLGLALAKVANRYDKELNKHSHRIASILPPIVIVVLALVVGTVMYSMLEGIFQGVAGLRTKTTR